MWKLLKLLAIWEVGWFVYGLHDRKKKYKQARVAANRTRKPLLVVGSPDGMYPCGDVTLDLRDTGECKPFTRASVEKIPFPDKHFGAVFVSHVLEHTCNAQKALAELRRVADSVFISYPRPWRLVTWLIPGHTWLMWEKNGEYRFKRIRRTCNQPKFFGDLEKERIYCV